jgi:2-phosphosulfolactate phosphatase
MKLDVLFTPVGLTLTEVQGRTVFVIDILRATTSMCAAMSSGAKAMLPVSSPEEALRLAQTIGSDDVLLAGERHCLRIEGFPLGNSPLEMTEAAVRGKTIVITTTNGTKALLACQGAEAVHPVCAGNLSLAAERAREALEREGGILVVCAGRFPSTMPTAPAAWSPPRSAGPEAGGGATMRRSRVSTWCGATARSGSGRSAGAARVAS